jgi:hypothetical protein
MAILRHAGALLLAALLLGCTRDPLPIQPVDDRLMVHGVLEAGVDTAFIHLTEIRARSRGGTLDARPVSGALVELSGGGITLRLREAPDGFARCLLPPHHGSFRTEDPALEGKGCYAALVSGGVRAGERYELRISLPDGRLVHGAAQVPASLELLQPLAEARLSAGPSFRGVLETDEPVTLRWRASPSTPRLAISVWSEAVFRGGTALPGDACRATLEQGHHSPWTEQILDPHRDDSLAQRVIVTGCNWQILSNHQRPDSLHVRLRATALDSAFVRYLEIIQGNESVRLGDAAVGLEGAVGVFAGIAPAEQRLVLVRRNEP